MCAYIMNPPDEPVVSAFSDSDIDTKPPADDGEG
jgi:hypothetical protein